MKNWTKTAGLLFMAASSVYYGQAVTAAPVKSASPANGGKSPNGTDVRLIEELAPAKPASTAKAAAAPKPSDEDATSADAVPAAPAKEGKSVSKSEVNVTDE